MLRGTGVSGVASITGGTIGTGTTGLPTLLAQSWVAVATPADTTEDTLATITVPAGLIGANGAIRIKGRFSFTNNANNKTVRIRYSGGAGTLILNKTYTTQLLVSFDLIMSNSNSPSSQVVTATGFDGGGGVFVFTTTAAIDTTASTSLVFTGTKASAGDSLTLDGYTIEVVH
jgi:hypothetical protein